MHQEIFASKNGVIQRIISLTPLRSAYEQTSKSIFRTYNLCHHNFGHSKVISRPLRDLELKMVCTIAIAMSTNPHILGCMAHSSIISSRSF